MVIKLFKTYAFLLELNFSEFMDFSFSITCVNLNLMMLSLFMILSLKVYWN